MRYLERIDTLKARLEAMDSPARLDLPFVETRPPTQAFSDFLTNKEQGDWAERSFVENFNRSQADQWAVKYGRSEDLVAGEPGFDDYYKAYQAELRDIGKRPDLLLFDRRTFVQAFGEVLDISNWQPESLAAWVPRAQMAVEVRSSAFRSQRYDQATAQARTQVQQIVREQAQRLLQDYGPELQRNRDWDAYLRRVMQDGVDPSGDSPRALGLSSTDRLREASRLTKEINKAVRALAKRDFLSITPKAEDLTLVYRWIQRFDVPHHYCQVFFDRAVMLSFEDILSLLATPEREGRDYFIEADEKNQRKVTFKINVKLAREVLSGVELPNHSSAMKELPKGRLLFYVTFQSSRATLVPGAFERE